MARIAEADLVAKIRQRVEQALSASNATQAQYTRAFRQFFLQPNGTESDGHPTIQSNDVNGMITAVTAQMVISFATDQVVEFEADSSDDEQRSKAESRAVNRVLARRGGFKKLLDGVQNALLYRNGYLKVHWSESKETYTVKHKDIEPDELPVVLEEEQNIERRLVRYDKEAKTATVEITERTKNLDMDPVANDRFFIDPGWDRQSFVDCPLAGEVHYKTRDELARMGVPWEIVKDLNAVQRNSGQETTKKRRGIGDSDADPISFQMDVCRVYEVYARYGEDDEDERAYLHKVWIGDTGDQFLIEPQLRDRMPYATGTAFPVANQHQGEGLSEKLYHVQEGKTELLRQWITNVRNCSWGRFGVVTGNADASDVLTPRPGGAVRMKQPNAISPIPIIDVGPSIAAALEYLDKMRSEAGGAALDMVGAEMQLANDTAHGTERVYASKELLVSYMTRCLSVTLVQDAFLLAHAELRNGGGGPISFKMAEQWVSEDPAQWPVREYCNISTAPSMGERMHMQQVLMGMINWYIALLAQGLGDQLPTLAGLYKLLCDWLRLGLVDNAEAYFVDPQSDQAVKAGQDKAAQQQAQAQAMQQLEQQKTVVDKYKTDQKTGFDYFNAVLQAHVDMSKTEAQGAVDVVNARTEAELARRSEQSGASGGNGSAPKKRVASGGGGNGKRPAAEKAGGNGRSAN